MRTMVHRSIATPICMDYLSKGLTVAGIKFQPKCNAIKLDHLAFAYDLMIFCFTKLQSLEIITDTFNKFSVTLGLQANLQKSQVITRGVEKHIKQAIL